MSTGMHVFILSALLTLIGIIPAGCATSTGTTVRHEGPMARVMRGGEVQRRVELKDITAHADTIAVGALEGLSGEVTVVDGALWTAEVTEHGELSVTGPQQNTSQGATLLTWSQVRLWSEHDITVAASGTALDRMIERAAADAGIPTTTPFPFRIRGTIRQLTLHVINGYCPHAVDPDTREDKPWTWSSAAPVDVTIVGFFAPDAGGVMTHHGTAIHAHALLTVNGQTITGHIDAMRVEPGMTLELPAR